jgi:hypothetical protein
VTGIRPIIDDAVASVLAEHPKYFTERGMEKAQAAFTRKIMAALIPRSSADDAEPQPARLAPPADLAPLTADPKSREARAYANLRTLAGATAPFRMGDGSISIPPEAQCPAVYALADMPAQPSEFITERQQIGAWMEFFAESLPKGTPRKPIQIERAGKTGVVMPWPWPPSVTGKVYAPNPDDVVDIDAECADESEAAIISDAANPAASGASS